MRAVVKNLTDVETLGATSAINTDKTGTLTMNQMMVSTLYASGTWFHVEGEGYRKTGAITSAAGTPVPDFTRLALGLVLDSDATVADDGSIVGDPTEAALVVLAAKLGVDAEETRRTYPRLAEVPFDSEYKFMATFHRYRDERGVEHGIQLVKGGPRRARSVRDGRRPAERIAGPIDEAAPVSTRRTSAWGAGPRVLASRPACRGGRAGDADDPMSLTHDRFVGWSASSTRSAPRPRARSRRRCAPGSTSA
jgi:Ca2+-transporting ATPase